MVFEWVTAKFKQRQLQKALIKEKGDEMVVVSGMSVLNPTFRTHFKDMPFYDSETDSIDFMKLDDYIYMLKDIKGFRLDEECKSCYYRETHEEFFDKLNHLIHSTYEDSVLEFWEEKELEHLRKLFVELTGETDYWSYVGRDNLLNIVKDYREQYRDLDETISNFENKIYEKNKEIERLQIKLENKESEVENKPKVSFSFEDKVNVFKEAAEYTRSSPEVLKFKSKVKDRDKVCQCCGSTEDIHVHHLSAFSSHNSRAADMDNGIALCKECHTQYHSIYGKNGKTNNPVTFAIFLREYGVPLLHTYDYTLDDVAQVGK